MKNTIFTGAGVAIITPMLQDGSVDFEGLKKLIDFQVDNGTGCHYHLRNNRRIFHAER